MDKPRLDIANVPREGWLRPVRGSNPRREIPLTRKESHRVYRRVLANKAENYAKDLRLWRWMEARNYA